MNLCKWSGHTFWSIFYIKGDRMPHRDGLHEKLQRVCMWNEMVRFDWDIFVMSWAFSRFYQVVIMLMSLTPPLDAIIGRQRGPHAISRHPA